MIRRQLTVKLREGVHLRVATAIVELVEQHRADVVFEHQSQQANARSAIELLALGLVPGAEVELRAEGPDEALVMGTLIRLLGDGASGR